MKTKFNKMERNHDGNAPIQNKTGISVFDRKIRGLGAKRYEELSIEDIHRAHFYVLNNCDETYDYIQQHKEELKSESNRNIEKRHQSEFQEWLVRRVTQELKDGRPGVTENLLNLVEGPEQRVYRHRGCVTNGLRFRTQESEKHLRTQNSGVVVKSYHQEKTIDFYGVINDIIELIYLGDHRVFIFKCDWWDLGSSAGILVDSNNYISVNVKRTWYKEDPFILAFQADQVFYLKDTKNGDNWRVVQKVFPRSVYNFPEPDEDTNAEESNEEMEPLQEDEINIFDSEVEINDQGESQFRNETDYDVEMETTNDTNGDTFVNVNEMEDMQENDDSDDDSDSDSDDDDDDDDEDDDDDDDDDEDDDDDDDDDDDADDDDKHV